MIPTIWRSGKDTDSYRNSKKISDARGSGEGGINKHRRFLEQCKYSVCYCNGEYMSSYICQNL